MIKETSIMYVDEMVRAILEDRKTMTRRIVNPQPGPDIDALHGNDLRGRAPYRIEDNETGNIIGWGFEDDDGKIYRCKYKTGERLWVREGVYQVGHERTGKNGQYLWPKVSRDFVEADARRWFDSCCNYTADMKRNDPTWSEPGGRLNKMFMPRWASRITLEITDVKVERVQEISIEDSKSEGVMPLYAHEMANAGHGHDSRRLFQNLWDKINGQYSWDKSPWVWVVSFKRIPT